MKKVIFVFLLLCSIPVFAHEQWMLSPLEILQLNKQPTPYIFHHFTQLNIIIMLSSLLFLFVWIFLGKKLFKHAFSELRLKISKKPVAIFFLSLLTGLMLLIATFDWIPIHPAHTTYSSYLLAPDLQLQHLPEWCKDLRWFQLAIALLLILGIGVRLSAMALIVLCFICLFLFGVPALAYLGFYLGIAMYLLFQTEASLLVLRVLTGLGFLYSAVMYKWLQPNLDLGILVKKHVELWGIDYVTFVFSMACVETVFAVLILTGIMIRPLSVILFGLFLFTGVLMGENPLIHLFIYGILITFMIKGGGKLKRIIG